MARTRAAHLGPERRRPQILDAALSLAAGRGTRAISMEAVAQQLGVTKPVIYSCFASREELLAALLEREEQRLFSGVMAALPNWQLSDKPELVMTQGFQALLRAVADHADAWQLVFATDPEPAIADRYAHSRQLVAQRVSALMRPALVLWQVQDIERKLPVLVELFMSTGDGAVRALLHSDGQWTPDELGALIARIVLAGLQQA